LKDGASKAASVSSPDAGAGTTAATDSVTTASGDEESPDVAGTAGVDSGTGTRAPASAGTTILVGLVAMIMILLLAPLLAGFSSPILLLILGFGVYKAWTMNRRANVELTGPFTLRPATSVPDAA
jgi:hypothetical protein